MMRNKYLIAYLGWVAGTLMMSGIAVVWYRKVEEIGWREFGSRMRVTTHDTTMPATEATEATDGG